MLTGIMLLFEVGLALTGQSFFSENQQDHSYRVVANQSERFFLKMLTDSQNLKTIGTGRSGNLLCQQILCRIYGFGCLVGNSQNSLLENSSLKLYTTARITSSLISSSCVLERPLDFPDTNLQPPLDFTELPEALIKANYVNRVLIIPNRYRPESGYELYGCILENQKDFRCSFEK